MELSPGFNNLDLKTNKTHSKKSSCIIPKEIAENINLKIIDVSQNENNRQEIGKEVSNLRKNKSLKINFEYNSPSQEHNFSQGNNEKVKNYVLNNFQNTNEQSYYILEKYGESLSAIYKLYCSFGDPLNKQLFMKNPKFTKLLRDAGLIIDSRHKNSIKPPLIEKKDDNDGSSKKNFIPTGIKLNDIDPIFFKLANYNQTSEKEKLRDKEKGNMNIGMYYRKEHGNFEDFYSKRNIINSGAQIDFNIFINAIEVIAALIFPNEPSSIAIDKVVENILSVGNLHENKNSLDPQIEYLKLKDEQNELVRLSFVKLI